MIRSNGIWIVCTLILIFISLAQTVFSATPDDANCDGNRHSGTCSNYGMGTTGWLQTCYSCGRYYRCTDDVNGYICEVEDLSSCIIQDCETGYVCQGGQCILPCQKTFNPAQPELGGEHCGDDWLISANTEIAGVHTGIGLFEVTSGATAVVKKYDGADYGLVEIHTQNIHIDGTIDASGSGYSGGNGGKGGNSGGCGKSGASGQAGSGTFGGALGTGGSGGGTNGDNSCGSNCRYLHGSNGNIGKDGGYAVSEGQGDTTEDESLSMGSGGSGAGGGGSGSREGSNCGYPGGTGGGGGAGGSGGGIIKLYASNNIQVLGSLKSKGTLAGNGRDGNFPSSCGRWDNPTGGSGGSASSQGTSSGGNGKKGVSCHSNGGASNTQGGNGGAGGSGAGGGILIKSPSISISGTIDNRGGNDLTTNGGTVKFFCTQTPTIDEQKIFRGRLFQDPVGCLCIPKTKQDLLDLGYECGIMAEPECGISVDLGRCQEAGQSCNVNNKCLYDDGDTDGDVSCTSQGYHWFGHGGQDNCCGDDASENYLFRDELNTELASIDDDNADDVCCDYDKSCVYGGTCYDPRQPISIEIAVATIDKKITCNPDGAWVDCDTDTSSCTNCGLNWAQLGITTTLGEYQVTDPPTPSCCGDDEGENYNYFKTVDSLQDTLDSVCCDSSTDCIYQGSCINTGDIQQMLNDKRRCIDGIWSEPIIQKPDWNTPQSDCSQSANCGYCNNNTACFVSSNGGCIASGEYISDHFCENGTWTSRTKLIALHLLEYANTNSPNDYVLFCDDYHSSLNHFDYYDGDGKKARDYLEASCNSDKCVNKVCVLKYGSEEIIFSTALNKQINKTPLAFKDILPDYANCNNAFNTMSSDIYGSYYQCSPNNILYNAKTNSVVYSNKAISLTAPVQGFWQSFLSFIRNPFVFIFDKIINRLNQPISPQQTSSDLEYIRHTKDFNRIYISRLGEKSITGIIESNISRDHSKDSFISVKYSCFNSNICSSINKYGALLESKSSGAENISCFHDGSDEYIQYQSSNRQTSILGLKTWLELTTKIRPDDSSPKNDIPVAKITSPRNNQNVFGGRLNPIEFKGKAIGCNPPFTYLWDFGDGTTSNELNPTHVFTTAGSTRISLTVTDSDRQAHTKLININIFLDTTAPDAPSNLQTLADDAKVTLSWTNPNIALPKNQDFDGVIILRSTSPIAANALTAGVNYNVGDQPTTGVEVIYKGTLEGYIDTGLTNRQTYYYAIYSHDLAPNYSPATTISATPIECYQIIWTDTLTSDFSQGTHDANVDISGDEIKLILP